LQTNYEGGCCGAGIDDAFVSKLNQAGDALIYSTYLGGMKADTGRGIAIDHAGNAYVAGMTDSPDFPLTFGSLRSKSPFYRSTNGALNWGNENLGLKGEIVTALAIDPITPSTIYAGTRTGAFKSTDGGMNWSPINTGLTVRNIVELVVDPVSPSTLYLAAYDVYAFSGNGIYKSTDGGAHWSLANNQLTNSHVMSLAIDPKTPSTLYAGTYGGPVFKTVDGANTWTPSSNPQTLNFVVSIAIDPVTPTNIYAGASMSNGGVFKSTDGGASWQRVANGSSVAVNPLNPSIVFVSGGGLLRSTDSGNNWTSLGNHGGEVVFDPVNPLTIYLLKGWEGLQKSTDGGDSWSTVNNGLDYLGVQSLVVNPARPATIYAGLQVFPSSTESFVTKLNPTGTALSYSTLLGSSQALGIAVDSANAAYVTGLTGSQNFAVTPDSYQPFNRGFTDVFVSKVTQSYVIRGRVVAANASPLGGVEVTLSGAQLRSVLTENDGSYQFTNLPEGASFTVSAAQAHQSFTPQSHSFNNLSADQTANFTAASSSAPFYTISGRVVNNGIGLGGATVTLSGSQVGLTKTDNNGNYSFTVPGGGNYALTPSLLGFSLSPGNQAFNNLSASQTADFTATRLGFVVTNTNNHGAGSLHQAILDANATAGADTIVFNIPGPGVKTIALRGALPNITDPVTIDGTTQPGFSGTPIIELNGREVTEGSGLKITAGSSTVRGLSIYSFRFSGIQIETAGGNVIQGNYIGTTSTGGLTPINQSTGIGIYNSSNNKIGGTNSSERNLISGTSQIGIVIGGTTSSNNLIQGNIIGLNAAGTDSLGNSSSGIEINGTNNTVGGDVAGARNVIAGNMTYKIKVTGSGNRIQGNFIGTDVSGLRRPGGANYGSGIDVAGTNNLIGGTTPGARNIISGNPGFGIDMDGSQHLVQGNYIGTDLTGAVALGNGSAGISVSSYSTTSAPSVIGGTTPEARNVISGNGGWGNIDLHYNSSPNFTGAIVQGNYIGTDLTGNVALDNPANGITISSSNFLIGGSTPGARNIISGNKVGIQLGGATTALVSNNVIQSNYIGLNASGNVPLPNTQGGITSSNHELAANTIGGTNNGEGNVIAFNGGGGVSVYFGGGNAIRGNSIFSNTRLGIDLGSSSGVTTNDASDVDTGANALQNYPSLTSVNTNGSSTTIQGTLNSKPNTTFSIDFYSNGACDPSGYGEGARFFNSTQVTTDQSGNANINVTFPTPLPAGRVLTATATDPVGNTSEFSTCNASEAVGSLEFSTATFNVLEDVGSATITVLRTGGSKGALSVNYSTGAGSATAGTDYTAVNGTLTFADGETSKTFVIPVTNDGVTEADEAVRLTLGGVSDVELLGANGAAIMNIQDSSTQLTLYGADVTVVEGNAGETQAMVTINLTAATGRTVSVSYSNGIGNGAQSGKDYQPFSGTLTFAPGVTSQTFAVAIIGDALDEGNEWFTVNLSNPVNAVALIPHPTVFITDDDDAPTVSIEDVSIVEGNSATITAVFNVTLSGASGKIVRVNYTMANGSATAESDFVSGLGTLIFNPGETTKTIFVTVVGDTVVEPDETFFVNLTSANNATIIRAQGTGTILNDESPGKLQFSSQAYNASEGADNSTITVTRTDGASGVVQVDYSTSNGTASAGADYTATSGTLTFNQGESSKSFSIHVINDGVNEGDETVNLTLSNPTGGASLGNPTTAVLTIKEEVSALYLIVEESETDPNQAAAIDATLFLRDPFPVINPGNLLNLDTDKNTRIIVFVTNLQLAQDEPSSSVVVHLTDAHGINYEVEAEDVRLVPLFNFTQVRFRLPDNLSPGTCTIKVKAHNQESNSGTIRIRN
jgi:photosystem II stability/assembly factor-like uncharacterized protein